jgi:hypothetical protein
VSRRCDACKESVSVARVALRSWRDPRTGIELSDFSAVVLLVSGGPVLAVLSMHVRDRISLQSTAVFLLATGLLTASIDALDDTP